ncbi:hypothetical protein ABZY20_36580, partial [Streptomyces sp. NPDC006624]|uniref:hypothetical protein n=1 Tax=Streptomyces sp. NPDC006624 TaxID=3154892 RepID=UPI0033A3CF3B
GLLPGDGNDAPDLAPPGRRGRPGQTQAVTTLRAYRIQARLLRALAEPDVAGARKLIAVVRERIAAGKNPQTRAQWQPILGGAYALAEMTSGQGTAAQDGIEALDEAIRGGTGSEGPQRTLRTARLAATLAIGEQQWAAAEQTLKEALRQIHTLRTHGIPETTRHAWLQQGRTLVGDLVTCLATLNRAEKAAVAIEEHRAVLLSEALGDRAESVGLEQVAPTLARDYRTAARELHRFDGSAETHRGDLRTVSVDPLKSSGTRVFDAPPAQAAAIRARSATRAGTCHTRPPFLMCDELWPGCGTLLSFRTREREGPWTLVGGCGSD